ncbi:Hypothetical protein FKW44_018317, partial [Caligus rogercresseyi]
VPIELHEKSSLSFREVQWDFFMEKMSLRNYKGSVDAEVKFFTRYRRGSHIFFVPNLFISSA